MWSPPPWTGTRSPKASFFTTGGSGHGSISCASASDNSVFSLGYRSSVWPPGPPGKRLFYTATFDNTILGIAPGTELRPEVIVSVAGAHETDFNVSGWSTSMTTTGQREKASHSTETTPDGHRAPRRDSHLCPSSRNATRPSSSATPKLMAIRR